MTQGRVPHSWYYIFFISSPPTVIATCTTAARSRAPRRRWASPPPTATGDGAAGDGIFRCDAGRPISTLILVSCRWCSDQSGPAGPSQTLQETQLDLLTPAECVDFGALLEANGTFEICTGRKKRFVFAMPVPTINSLLSTDRLQMDGHLKACN